MDLAAYGRELHNFYKSTDLGGLLISVPGGSGICNFPRCNVGTFSQTYTSSVPSRWRLGEETHYGDMLRTSTQELYGGLPADPSQELVALYRTSCELPAINIYAFPKEFQEVMYEDKFRDARRFEKPNLTIQLFHDYYKNHDVFSVLAPSASGIALGTEGSVFVTDIFRAKPDLLVTGYYSELSAKFPGTF